MLMLSRCLDITHNTLDPKTVASMNGRLPKVQPNLTCQYHEDTGAMMKSGLNKRGNEIHINISDKPADTVERRFFICPVK